MKENKSVIEGDRRESVPSSSLYVYALDFICINAAMLALFSVLVNGFEGAQHKAATLI